MKTFLTSVSFVSVLVLAHGAIAQSSSPSFDCSKASSEAEKLVCTDDELAELDRNMASVFAKAVENFPKDELSSLKATQRGWIKGRDDCWKADDLRECVEYAYRSRIVELQIQSGQLEAATPVGYSCEGSEAPVLVAFYSQTDPASAVITVGSDQIIAFHSHSGSGAKYTAANVELWEHHGEATLDWFGTSYRCRAR